MSGFGSVTFRDADRQSHASYYSAQILADIELQGGMNRSKKHMEGQNVSPAKLRLLQKVRHSAHQPNSITSRKTATSYVVGAPTHVIGIRVA
jgi:hypothetical protein